MRKPKTQPSRKTKVAKSEPPKFLWVVMKAYEWSSVQVAINGFPLMAPPEGPHRLMPVFNTKDQAVAWCGDERLVRMMEAA